MSIQANKKLTQRLMKELWTDHRPDVIDEIISKDCVFQARGREFRGPKGYREFYDMYVTAFPDLSIQVNDIIGEDDVVVTSYTARGQHSGPLMGIEPTGKQVTVPGMSMTRFEGGKMVDVKTLWNEMSLMQQLDVLPESLQQKLA